MHVHVHKVLITISLETVEILLNAFHLIDQDILRVSGLYNAFYKTYKFLE